MSNKEILEKAIQKALDNGWQEFETKHRGRKEWEVSKENSLGYPVPNAVITRVWGMPGQYEYRLNEIIYSHDFAKALWPDEDGSIYWRMHLERMVILDDPIKYLGEHI